MGQRYLLKGGLNFKLRLKVLHMGCHQVPVLISQNCISGLLLGFNVIEEIILESLEKPGSVSLSDLLAEALKLHRDTAETIVSAVWENPVKDHLLNDTVRVGKKGVIIHSGQVCEIRCHVKSRPLGVTVLFEPTLKSDLPEGLQLIPALVNAPTGSLKVVKIPVTNQTKHNIFLPARTTLGHIEEILEYRFVNVNAPKANSETLMCAAQVNKASDICNSSPQSSVTEKWHPPVDLQHLEPEQQEVVRQMLYEESDVFAKGEGNIGCIPDLQLKINVVGNNPVQKCYNSIPKPLYKEVKDYVQNLLNRGWIRKSTSS